FAQRHLTQGRHQLSNRTFLVEQGRRETFFVREVNNKTLTAYKSNPQLYSTKLSTVTFANSITIGRIFVDVLGKSRIRELLPTNNNAVTLYLESTGKIGAVEFFTKANGGLTLDEIDKINSALKRSVSIDIPADVQNKDKIAPITQVIHFRKLL